MIKIVFLVSSLKRTGPTKQLINILTVLDKERYSIVLITLHDEPLDSLKDNVIFLGVDVRCLNIKGLISYPRAIIRLKYYLAEFSPDIVHSHGIKSDTFNVLFASNLKKVSSIRCIFDDDYCGIYGPKLGSLIARIHFGVCSRMDYLIPVSNTIKDSLLNKIRKPVVKTIFNVLSKVKDINKFDTEAIKCKLGFPEESIVWITTGRISPRKCVDVLLRVFRKIINDQSKSNVFFLVLGDGVLYEQFSKKYGNENIKFLGWVSNVEEYLGVADFFVSASKSEGLPNSVLEAMGYGLPVLLSDIGPHMEITSIASAEGRAIGSVFSLGNEKSCMEQVLAMHEMPYEKLSSEVKQVVNTHFSIEKLAENYNHFYAECVSNES